MDAGKIASWKIVEETMLRVTHNKKKMTQEMIEKLQEEKDALSAALDESEKLRKEVISELNRKEQEIITKAEEFAQSVELHKKELSAIKDQEFSNNAQQIEAKIQEKEARKKAEMEKIEAERKLTKVEKELLKKAEELEQLHTQNAEELSAKDKEIFEIATELKGKKKLNELYRLHLEKTEALRVEIENELTAKKRFIQEQATQIEQLAKDQANKLSEKEKEISEKSKELKEREKAAIEAQKKQNEAIELIQKLRDDYEMLDSKKQEKESLVCSPCSPM